MKQTTQERGAERASQSVGASGLGRGRGPSWPLQTVLVHASTPLWLQPLGLQARVRVLGPCPGALLMAPSRFSSQPLHTSVALQATMLPSSLHQAVPCNEPHWAGVVHEAVLSPSQG